LIEFRSNRQLQHLGKITRVHGLVFDCAKHHEMTQENQESIALMIRRDIYARQLHQAVDDGNLSLNESVLQLSPVCRDFALHRKSSSGD
jgi:hypothetical protein